MSIHEACGVFGVMADHLIGAARICYYGLYALQHRGQESCGIVVNDDGLFASQKDLGLVSEVFTKDRLAAFPKGSMAVAHTRYGTTGATNRSNCQPIEVNHQKGRMAIAHNGNLSNAAELRSALELTGAIFHTSSGTGDHRLYRDQRAACISVDRRSSLRSDEYTGGCILAYPDVATKS